MDSMSVALLQLSASGSYRSARYIAHAALPPRLGATQFTHELWWPSHRDGKHKVGPRILRMKRLLPPLPGIAQ